MGMEMEGLPLPEVPVKTDSWVLFRKCTYTGLPAGERALPGSLLTPCKPSSQGYVCTNVFIFISELIAKEALLSSNSLENVGSLLY